MLMIARTSLAIIQGCGAIAPILTLVLGLAACEPPGAPVDAAPFVLTSSGAQVLSDAPPGFEVTLRLEAPAARRRPARPRIRLMPDSLTY
jgi:hypothetical protein